MKIFDIALKDLTRSFRSVFAVMFMFVIPLLVTGLFFVMFGGLPSNDAGFNLPQTTVVVANLDEGSPDFSALMQNQSSPNASSSLGELLLSVLQSPDLADLILVSSVPSAQAAYQQVDTQQAGVAVIIPAGFSRALSDPNGEATLEVYQDPTLTLGPAIIRSILNQFTDGFSATRIMLDVTLSQTGSSDPSFISRAIESFLVAVLPMRTPHALLAVQPPNPSQQEVPLILGFLGPIMGGMMIFYAFYTGTATAETLLQEDELGTLPRLFTTPTHQSVILGGKLLAVLLTVTIQVAVLLLSGALLFRIHWGTAASILLIASAIVLVASSFGVFVNSFLKNTKQGGIVFGGVLTFSGMLGLMPIFVFNNPSSAINTISLFVPQGWAVRGLLQSMQQASFGQLGLTVLVLLVWAIVFFVIGALRFQKRYA